MEKMVKMNSLQSLFKQVYQGKKVFLTGHTGFKGAWLLYWLHSIGAVVKGYALTPQYRESLYTAIGGDKLCASIFADIRDQRKLEKEIIDFQPDFIFHLAAQSLVRLSYEVPSETFSVNAIGTSCVLDAMRVLKKSCTGIFITTDKVYENKEWVYPYRENDPLGGHDPYSASKACAELIISSYRSSFFNPKHYDQHQKGIASARAGNVIGGGDWAKDRIIPDIVRALSKKETIVVRNPTAVRPWEHVLDPLCGYLLLGCRLEDDPIKFADAWNFGPNTEDNRAVEDVVKTALNIWGAGEYSKPELKNQPHEAGILKLDISKSKNVLNWHPRWNSDEAIKHAILWYKDFLKGDPASEIISRDINTFLN